VKNLSVKHAFVFVTNQASFMLFSLQDKFQTFSNLIVRGQRERKISKRTKKNLLFPHLFILDGYQLIKSLDLAPKAAKSLL
jgi:hypothetical protein